MYEIKEMTIQDYDRVAKFWSEVEDFAISLEFDNRNRISSYLTRNPGLSSIALCDEDVIGTVLCGHDGRRGSVYHVVVSREHRGNGISKRLIERSVDQLRAVGIDNGFLFVNTSDDNALSFWKHNGWNRFDAVMYHYKLF